MELGEVGGQEKYSALRTSASRVPFARSQHRDQRHGADMTGLHGPLFDGGSSTAIPLNLGISRVILSDGEAIFCSVVRGLAPTQGPQADVAPIASGCGADPELCQLLTRATHCRFEPFQGLGRCKGRSAPMGLNEVYTSTRSKSAPSAQGTHRVLIGTNLFDNPQENAAENFRWRKVPPVAASARFVRRATPFPQESATASSSGRAALVAARANRESLQRANRELTRENRSYAGGRRPDLVG